MRQWDPILMGLAALLLFSGAVSGQQEYLCFKNTGAQLDFHYYYLNETASTSYVQVYQGFDHVVGTGTFPLTGTFNTLSHTYSFNTNQPTPPPATIYINQWSVDSVTGNWTSGFIYGIAQDASLATIPITLIPVKASFRPCPSQTFGPQDIANLK